MLRWQRKQKEILVATTLECTAERDAHLQRHAVGKGKLVVGFGLFAADWHAGGQQRDVDQSIGRVFDTDEVAALRKLEGGQPHPAPGIGVGFGQAAAAALFDQLQFALSADWQLGTEVPALSSLVGLEGGGEPALRAAGIVGQCASGRQRSCLLAAAVVLSLAARAERIARTDREAVTLIGRVLVRAFWSRGEGWVRGVVTVESDALQRGPEAAAATRAGHPEQILTRFEHHRARLDRAAAVATAQSQQAFAPGDGAAVLAVAQAHHLQQRQRTWNPLQCQRPGAGRVFIRHGPQVAVLVVGGQRSDQAQVAFDALELCRGVVGLNLVNSRLSQRVQRQDKAQQAGANQSHQPRLARWSRGGAAQILAHGSSTMV